MSDKTIIIRQYKTISVYWQDNNCVPNDIVYTTHFYCVLSTRLFYKVISESDSPILSTMEEKLWLLRFEVHFCGWLVVQTNPNRRKLDVVFAGMQCLCKHRLCRDLWAVIYFFKIWHHPVCFRASIPSHICLHCLWEKVDRGLNHK